MSRPGLIRVLCLSVVFACGAEPEVGEWVGVAESALATTSFTLVNAVTDQDIGPLANGATINLATLPTRNLNIRANTDTTVGSVRFTYDGAVVRVDRRVGPRLPVAPVHGEDLQAARVDPRADGFDHAVVLVIVEVSAGRGERHHRRPGVAVSLQLQLLPEARAVPVVVFDVHARAALIAGTARRGKLRHAPTIVTTCRR